MLGNRQLEDFWQGQALAANAIGYQTPRSLTSLRINNSKRKLKIQLQPNSFLRTRSTMVAAALLALKRAEPSSMEVEHYSD